MHRRRFLSLVPATLLLAACEAMPEATDMDILISARLAGDIRRGLPSDARLILELADVSLADAPAIRIAQAVLGPKDTLALVVPRLRLRVGRTHALSLRIESSKGKLVWISDSLNALPTEPPARVRFGELSMVRAEA